MKTVIRIEHPSDGWGLFRSLNDSGIDIRNITEVEVIQARHWRFHTPWMDGLNITKDDKEWFCAYKSLAQLSKLVLTHEFKYLANAGFIIYLLEVGEYQEGRDQVIFTKESIINKKNISDLFL